MSTMQTLRNTMVAIALSLEPNGNGEYARGMAELITLTTCEMGEDCESVKEDILATFSEHDNVFDCKCGHDH